MQRRFSNCYFSFVSLMVRMRVNRIFKKINIVMPGAD